MVNKSKKWSLENIDTCIDSATKKIISVILIIHFKNAY